MILISLPLFLVLWPTLIGGYDFTAPENERFQQFFYFYKEAISSSDSVFWNPYLFSGFPTFASLTGGFLNPLMFLAIKFLSVSLAYNWMNFLYFSFAGFFMFRLLKKMNIFFWASLAGGIIYPFSQWSQNHDISVSSSLFLLPLLFLIILRAKEDRWLNFWLGSLAGSAAAALVWFSSHWHFMVEITLAVFLFSVFLSLGAFLKDEKKFLRPFLAFLSVTAGGILFGLFQLVPTYIYISLSIRLGQIVSHLAATQAGVNFQDAIGFFLPYFNYPFSALSSYYVDYWGILPLFLFLLAFEIKFFKNIFSGGEEKGYIAFFSFLFLFALITAFKYSPLFWLLHHLPVVNLLHETSRWMLLASFSVAALAGFSLEIILRNTEELKKSQKFKIALGALKWSGVFLADAALVSFVFLYVLKNNVLSYAKNYFDKNIYGDDKFFSIDYYHSYIDSLFYDLFNSFNFLNPKFFVPFVFLAGGYLAIRYLFKRSLTPKVIVIFIVLIITSNFVAVYSLNDNIAKRKPLYSESESIEFIKENGEGRVFSFLRFLALSQIVGDKNYSQNRSVLKKDILYPNKNIIFNLESPDYEGDPMVNKNMAKLVSYIGGVAVSEEDTNNQLENFTASPEEKSQIFSSRKPMVDFLGVRYILSPGSLDETRFAKVFETQSSVKQIPVVVYENRQYRPLYYFSNENWLINMDKNTQPEKLNDLLRSSGSKITQNGLALVEKKNNLLTLNTYNHSPQLLVFSQNNLPGWEVLVDGVPTELINIGTVYMGVMAPAGEHRVTFEYKYSNVWKYFLSNMN